jgi:hypothetical protein
MSLKNLMVHLDAGERTAARLELAAALARSHGARLTGVFGQRGAAQRVGVVATWPSEEYAAARDASKDAFAKATAGLDNAEWIDINRGSDAEVLAGVTRIARHFDLVVLGQRDTSSSNLLPEDFVNEVIVDSGRPVLVLPYAGSFAAIGKRPMIAWNDAREAARALNDALPLLDGSEECWVMSFATRQEDAEGLLQRSRTAPRRPWRQGQVRGAGGAGLRHHGPAAQPRQRPQRRPAGDGRPRPDRLSLRQPRRRHALHPAAHDRAGADVELKSGSPGMAAIPAKRRGGMYRDGP